MRKNTDQKNSEYGHFSRSVDNWTGLLTKTNLSPVLYETFTTQEKDWMKLLHLRRRTGVLDEMNFEFK